MEADWPQGSLGIYLHIPFCRRKCSYCDFYSVTGADPARLQAYAERLCREISACPQAHRIKPVDSIYFGGGTPSLLTPAQISAVLETLEACFHIRPDAEITMEVNPATVDRAALSGYREAGINRISLGVQSLQDEELAVLGRLHSAAAARETVAAAKQAGFENVSLDLIYGISGQTIDTWMQTVKEAVNCQPRHISMYLLQLDDEVPMARAIARGDLLLPGEEEVEAMYYESIHYLRQAGIMPYEISNLARAGFACRHNLRYWKFGEYLGFGAAAVSRVGRRRWMNVPDLEAYMGAAASGYQGQLLLEDMNPRQQAAEAVIMGLRLNAGLNVEDFNSRFGINLIELYQTEIRQFLQGGLLELEHGWLRLTKAGYLVSNRVFCSFVD